MNPDAILREIRSAFADVPRPMRTMSDTEVDDDDDERSRFEERDDHWWEIPDGLLDRCSAPFCFMSVEDFVYYLPAYMSWFVRTAGESKFVSGEWLIYYLNDPERGGRLTFLLTPHQLSAVRSFLEWILSTQDLLWIHSDASSALQGIWKQNAKPCAAPNGGPATRLGNTRLTEGPPSVS